MSKFLPIENIVYITKLSKEQIIQKLTENIEEEKSFGFGTDNDTYSKPYIGRLTGDYFKIKRAINHKNSFLPQIKGEIYSTFDGTKIKLNMKLQTFVLVFMTIWFGVVLVGCIATTVALFTQEFTPFIFIPFVMLVLGIALVYRAFKTESSISKNDLMIILEAEIEE